MTLDESKALIEKTLLESYPDMFTSSIYYEIGNLIDSEGNSNPSYVIRLTLVIKNKGCIQFPRMEEFYPITPEKDTGDSDLSKVTLKMVHDIKNKINCEDAFKYAGVN